MSSVRGNHEIRSTFRADGAVDIALVDAPVPTAVEDDHLVVEVLAAPINPSDIGPLLGPADPTTARRGEAGDLPAARLSAPAAAMGRHERRLGRPMVVGHEGAGRVVAAGPGQPAQALLGRTVGIIGNGTFARYTRVSVRDALPLPDGVTPAQGAAAFVNPLTALGMVETMRREGFSALVHTAAASNLGQMLGRLCREEGIGLVNVVRRSEQAELLRSQDAEHVCDTSQPTFEADLVAAVRATGAKLAFDAVGGGRLAGQILGAMEQAAALDDAGFPYGPQYGTPVRKQVYIYGSLDPGPVEVVRSFGMSWGMGGWLLFGFLESVGAQRTAELQERVMRGIATTFASRYSRTISLADLVNPEVLQDVARRATGTKYLLDPSR